MKFFKESETWTQSKCDKRMKQKKRKDGHK